MPLTRSRLLTLTLLALLMLSSGTIAAQDSAEALAGVHIYFSDSSNEASIFDRSEEGLSRAAGLLQQLGAEVFSLNWRIDIPEDADLIIIAGPSRDLSAEQMARLWVYLTRGGRLLLLAEPLVTSTSEGVITIEGNRALQSGRGFFELTWADFGVRGSDDVLIHEDEAVTSASREPSELIIDFEATARESNIIEIDPDEPLAFFGARTIEFDASIQPYRATALVTAPSEFYSETAFADFVETGILEFNLGSDERGGNLAVAVAVEHTPFNSRIILIGDRQFMTNGGGLQTSPPNSSNFVYPGNVQFALNSVAWLLGMEPAVSIPGGFSPPAPTATEAAPASPETTPEAAAPTNTPASTSSPSPTSSPEPEATEDANPGS